MSILSPETNNPIKEITPRSFLLSRVTIAVTLIRILFLIPKEWLPFDVSTIGWLLHSPEMSPFWTSTLIRPHETWFHIREAGAIRQLFGEQFRDAYRGSYVHVPPLVLAFCEAILDAIPSETLQNFVVGFISHLVDLAIATALLQIGMCVLNELRDPWEDALQLRVPESLRPPLEHAVPISKKEIIYTNELPPRIILEEGEQSTNTKSQPAAEPKNSGPPYIAWTDLPLLSAQLYYYSPFTALASGLGSTHRSFQNLWLLLLLQSIHKCSSSPSIVPLSSFYLALASYSEIHSVVYIVPLSLWLSRKNNSIIALWGLFLFWSICLQGLTILLVGESHYASVLRSSFVHVFSWKNLHPNLSVLWYLNMELFEQYRAYFAILIAGCPYLMVIPLTIRLYRYPMVLVTIFWMLWTLIRPSSTLVDANVAACLVALCPRSVARMRVPTSLIPAFAITVPISLYIVTLWMWLETGAGEANFTFFQCLAFCAFLATVFLEFCGASLRQDKVLRFTEKLLSKKTEEAANSAVNSEVRTLVDR